MSYLATKIFVEHTVKSFMDINYPEWTIRFPLVKQKDSNDPRVEVMVSDGKGFRANIGSRYFERVPGSVVLDVTVATEKRNSTNEIDVITDQLKKLFQEKNVRLNMDQSYLKFGIASWESLGDIGARYHHRITIPFERQEPPQLAQDTTFL